MDNENEKLVCEFVVLGKAQPAGSKSGIPIQRGDGSYVTLPGGKPLVAVVDSNKNIGEWKQSVRASAREIYNGPLVVEPVDVRMMFIRVRPKSHYRTGKNTHLLRADAPAYPAQKPDLLKLARGVEDALTGVVYRDDNATVDLTLSKRWGEPACVIVRIFYKDAPSPLLRLLRHADDQESEVTSHENV